MDGEQFQALQARITETEVGRRDHQAVRDKVKDLIKLTSVCDGSTTSAVRTWIREVTLAFNQVGATGVVEVASKTVSGPLHFEVERYIEGAMVANAVTRANISWDELRGHIATQFLNTDEGAALRDEVERVKQSSYEPEVQYSRRFREVVDAAYPADLRNDDQERLLVRAYARGLKSDELARKLVQDAHPPPSRKRSAP